MERIRGAWIVVLLTGLSFTARSQDDTASKHDPWKFDVELNLDYRYFPEKGLYKDQEQHYPGAAITPELHKEWNEGTDIFHFKGFFRYDYWDDQRTHGDIREMYYQRVNKNWEWSIGLKKVFWGVIESNHVVDFINQTDLVEAQDEKLGQPMVHISFPKNYGTFDFYILPYFRTFIFPGEKGRLRPDLSLFPDNIEEAYESENEEFNPDVAFRWSHYWKIFDFGISQFYGTSRVPVFQIEFDPTTNTITPQMFYETISRTGLDLQASTGPILWKGEAIYRVSERKNIFAYAAGAEYTFSNMWQSGIDLGILGEYLHDDRGRNESFNAMTRDVFAGARVAFNDRQSTDLLGGVITDLDNQTQMIFVEANRRIGDSWKLSLEYRGFNNVDPQEQFLYLLRADSYGQFRLTKYFGTKE